MCRTPDSAPRRHELNRVGRERFFVVHYSHHRPVPTHVFQPVFERSGEEASRLWCPHLFHNTGVMKVDSVSRVQIGPAVAVILLCHAKLTSRHTVQDQWRLAWFRWDLV